MLIAATDFYRMTEAIHSALSSGGITQVEQLAAMSASQIDALQIKGIGKVLSAKWQQTAVALLATQKGAPATAQAAVAKIAEKSAFVTCESLSSALAARLTLEVVGITLNLKYDGTIVASTVLP